MTNRERSRRFAPKWRELAGNPEIFEFSGIFGPPRLEFGTSKARTHSGWAFVTLCMTHRNAKVHPAMTALAAVIALSSTSLLAQPVDQPAVTTTPVIEVTPVPVVVDPVVTEPIVETPAAADPLAAKTATPARKAATTKATAARSRPAPARASNATRTAAAAPAAVITAPVAEVPVAQPLPPPTEIAAEPIAEPPATATTIDILPTAALGGLGLLLLGGAGLAIRSRRRRRAEEAQDAEWQQQAEAEPDEVAEPAMIEEPQPAMVAAPAPAMMAEQQPALELTQPAFVAATAPVPETVSGLTPIDGPTTDLPEDFDLSRFGFNVQQAYQGPTEDNPSLSLKHRLRRASGMDQQERKLEDEVEAVTGESPLEGADDPAPAAEAPAAKPAVATSAKGDFLFARDDTKAVVRPARTH